MDEIKQWWRNKWWLQEEYTRLYKERVAPEEVDRAVGRVINVFDGQWQRENPMHPALLSLLPQGTLPLHFLYSLAKDLEILEDCLRLKRVVGDLRAPSNYESALLEVRISAQLKRSGHQVEFRPPLPNGKESDFVASFQEQQVYFEIKRMEESQSQQALNYLSQYVHFAVCDLVRDSRHAGLAGQGFRVGLNPGLADLLGVGLEGDKSMVESIVQRIVTEIVGRAEREQSLDFEIPSVAKILVGDLDELGRTTDCPTATSQAELKRFLRGHFVDAIAQLHPAHAGLIVVQTPGHLEQGITEMVVCGRLSHLGPKGDHVSAVILFPTYNPLPTTWALFKPFAVTNGDAKFPAHSIRAFADLQPLLKAKISIPEPE